MDTKRNQTLEEIEENKIVSEHYQNRIKLIKELLKTSQLVIGDLCVHINISEASYHRYTNFTSYMKTDIFNLSQAIYRKSPHSLYPRRKTAYKSIRPVSDFLK